MTLPDLDPIGRVLHLNYDVAVAITIGAVIAGGLHHVHSKHKAMASQQVELYRAHAIVAQQYQPRRRRGGTRRPVFVLGVLAAAAGLFFFGRGLLHDLHKTTTAAPQTTPTPAPTPAPTHTVTVRVPVTVTKVAHEAQHFPVTLLVVVCVVCAVAAVLWPMARRRLAGRAAA